MSRSSYCVYSDKPQRAGQTPDDKGRYLWAKCTRRPFTWSCRVTNGAGAYRFQVHYASHMGVSHASTKVKMETAADEWETDRQTDSQRNARPKPRTSSNAQTTTLTYMRSTAGTRLSISREMSSTHPLLCTHTLLPVLLPCDLPHPSGFPQHADTTLGMRRAYRPEAVSEGPPSSSSA